MARPDTRPHRSLIDDEQIEWLGKMDKEEQVIVWSLINEAEEFKDQDLLDAMRRYIRTSAAVGGARVDLIAKVATRDEALRDAAELRSSGGPQGELPRKGP